MIKTYVIKYKGYDTEEHDIDTEELEEFLRHCSTEIESIFEKGENDDN